MLDQGCTQCNVLHKRGSKECPTSRVGTIFATRYCIDSIIGMGGMGAVYKARPLGSDVPVAIKVLHSSLAHNRRLTLRFLRETRALYNLKHSGFVQMIDAGRTPEQCPYIVMELLEGYTLASLLRSGPLPLGAASECAVQVLTALAIAHSAGIIHRDLKPENLFIDTRSEKLQVKVLDFGVAKVIEEEENVTTPGEILGTPRYMSPEQIEDLRGVDARSDIYSMGAILFHALTGRSPVEGASMTEVLGRVMLGQIYRNPRPFRPEVPEWLDEVVAHALEPLPDDRPSSALEMATAIREGMLTQPHLFAMVTPTLPDPQASFGSPSLSGRSRYSLDEPDGTGGGFGDPLVGLFPTQVPPRFSGAAAAGGPRVGRTAAPMPPPVPVPEGSIPFGILGGAAMMSGVHGATGAASNPTDSLSLKRPMRSIGGPQLRPSGTFSGSYGPRRHHSRPRTRMAPVRKQGTVRGALTGVRGLLWLLLLVTTGVFGAILVAQAVAAGSITHNGDSR